MEQYTLDDLIGYFCSHPPGPGLINYLNHIAEMSTEAKEQEIQVLKDLPCSQDSTLDELRQVFVFMHQGDNARLLREAIYNNQVHNC